jgi:hypothetical protein
MEIGALRLNPEPVGNETSSIGKKQRDDAETSTLAA